MIEAFEIGVSLALETDEARTALAEMARQVSTLDRDLSQFQSRMRDTSRPLTEHLTTSVLSNGQHDGASPGYKGDSQGSFGSEESSVPALQSGAEATGLAWNAASRLRDDTQPRSAPDHGGSAWLGHTGAQDASSGTSMMPTTQGVLERGDAGSTQSSPTAADFAALVEALKGAPDDGPATLRTDDSTGLGAAPARTAALADGSEFAPPSTRAALSLAVHPVPASRIVALGGGGDPALKELQARLRWDNNSSNQMAFDSATSGRGPDGASGASENTDERVEARFGLARDESPSFSMLSGFVAPAAASSVSPHDVIDVPDYAAGGVMSESVSFATPGDGVSASVPTRAATPAAYPVPPTFPQVETTRNQTGETPPGSLSTRGSQQAAAADGGSESSAAMVIQTDVHIDGDVVARAVSERLISWLNGPLSGTGAFDPRRSYTPVES